MRPITVTQATVGSSAAIPMNQYSTPFNIGFGCTTNGTVTYSVQHTFDDPFAPIGYVNQYVFTRLGSIVVATAPLAPSPYQNANTANQPYVCLNSETTGLAVSNQISWGNTNYSPVYAVQALTPLAGTSTTIVTLTMNLPNAISVGTPIYTVVAGSAPAPTLNWFNHATVALVSGAADGNYAFPVRAVRLLVTSGSGSVSATFLQAGIR